MCGGVGGGGETDRQTDRQTDREKGKRKKKYVILCAHIFFLSFYIYEREKKTKRKTRKTIILVIRNGSQIMNQCKLLHYHPCRIL